MGLQRVVMGISTLAILGITEIPKIYPDGGFSIIFIIFIVGHVVSFGFPVYGFINTKKKK